MIRKILSLCTILLCGSLILNSCIGSFALTGKVYEWNKNVSDKFVNELIFLVCNIVPVYPVVLFLDTIVLNSIEFWTGSSPMSNIGEVKNVKGKDGEYLVRTLENGYEISQNDQTMSFVYNPEMKTWSMISSDLTINADLLKINYDGTVTLFLPNGEINVTLDAQGIAEARQATMSSIKSY
ncbi:hypothetical protein EZS27_034987 [termite gut metagenome]|uniref:DUF3332 domain-containing protein n=1 Tax=termite gut metagenome TaxID=433724 RepID=A0A5J4PZS5_9ZZZZ